MAEWNTNGSAVLLRSIEPGLQDLDLAQPPDALIKAAVEANVHWSMRQLRETREIKARMQEGIFKLVGAIYELETGRVRFLE